MVSLTTQRTQRKVLRCVRCVRTLRIVRNATSCCMAIGKDSLQCTKLRHSKLLFCLFFCEKSVAAENEDIHFGQKIAYFFIRATKEANSVCSMYEHDHESFHHNFQSCQVWLYCSARLDRQRRQSDLCTSCHYHVKRRHVIGQTLRCLREIRTWVQLSSCVAYVTCVA